MRVERPKAKRRERVAIPLDLREFLTHVQRLMEAGDEAATRVSDDLLQCECAYGGLLEEGGCQFDFTYFPESGVRHKWLLVLDRSEVEDIASGQMTELEMWACADPACHSKFRDPKETCFYCDY